MSSGRDGNFNACRGLCRKLAWVLRIGECGCGCLGTHPYESAEALCRRRNKVPTAAKWQVVWADSRWYGPARMSNGRDGNLKVFYGYLWINRSFEVLHPLLESSWIPHFRYRMRLVHLILTYFKFSEVAHWRFNSQNAWHKLLHATLVISKGCCFWWLIITLVCMCGLLIADFNEYSCWY